MITIKYSNGYVGVYDETLKEGDIIIAYRKGYHEFVKYEPRGKEVPLIHYRQAYNANGKSCKSKIVHSCDAAYCRKALEYVNESIEKKKKELDALEKLQKRFA